jgi:hypothetical protein
MLPATASGSVASTLHPSLIAARLWPTQSVALSDPHSNRPASPSFAVACSVHPKGAKCRTLALEALRRARAREGVKHPAMVLPRNYNHLTVAQQTFVITNLERVDRGLPPFRGLVPRLNKTAHTAAVAHADPALATSLLQGLHVGYAGSIWAGDWGPLASDYHWMYEDGYQAGGGSINLACLTRRSPGCWGHRDNIIGKYADLPILVEGAGATDSQGRSIAVLFLGGSGSVAHGKYNYTWKQALRHGADRHKH